MKLRIAYAVAVWAFWVIGLVPLAHAQPLTPAPICSQSHDEYITACATEEHDGLGPMMGYEDNGKWNFMRQKDYDRMVYDKTHGIVEHPNRH